MIDEKEYFVYALLDMRKVGPFRYNNLDFCFPFEPFYIGKGKGARVTQHFWGMKNEDKFLKESTNPFKARTILKIYHETLKVPDFILIFKDLTEGEAFKKEEEVISQIGRREEGGPLTNILGGGLGGKGSFKGKHHTTEAKLKNSLAHKGKKAWNRGIPRTEEEKQKMRGPRPQMQGENNPSKRPEVRQKISEKRLGEGNARSRTWKILDLNTQKIIEFKGGISRWCKEHGTTYGILQRGNDPKYKLLLETLTTKNP